MGKRALEQILLSKSVETASFNIVTSLPFLSANRVSPKTFYEHILRTLLANNMKRTRPLCQAVYFQLYVPEDNLFSVAPQQ